MKKVFIATVLIFLIFVDTGAGQEEQDQQPPPLDRAQHALLEEQGVTPEPAQVVEFLASLSEDGAEKVDVRSLVEQLGARSLKKREKAQEKLTRVARGVLGKLRNAKNETNNPEIRSRLEQILQTVRSDIEPGVVYAALQQLTEDPKPAYAKLVLEILPTLNERVSFEAARQVLLQISSRDQLSLFRNALNSSHLSRRRAAIAVMGTHLKTGNRSPVVQALKSSKALERLAAARVLAVQKDDRALPVLVQLLGASSRHVRRVSFYLLYQLRETPGGVPLDTLNVGKSEFQDWKSWVQRNGSDALRNNGVADFSAETVVFDEISKRIRQDSEMKKKWKPLIRLIAPRLPEQPIGTETGERTVKEWRFNVFGQRFDAFRFRVPDDRARDLVWGFSMLDVGVSWYVLPVDPELERERYFNNAHHVLPDYQLRRQEIRQRLSSKHLEPGHSYVIWFSFKGRENRNIVPARVVANLVPAGKVSDTDDDIRDAIGGVLDTKTAKTYLRTYARTENKRYELKPEEWRERIKKLKEISNKLGRGGIPFARVLDLDGLYSFIKENYERAEKLYRRALRMIKEVKGKEDRLLFPIYQNLGQLFLKQGRIEKAITYLKKAQKSVRFPEFILREKRLKHRIRARLGMVYLHLGKARKAREAFEKSIRTMSISRYGYLGKWSYHMSRGNANKAREVLDSFMNKETTGEFGFLPDVPKKIVQYLRGEITMEKALNEQKGGQGGAAMLLFWMGAKHEFNGKFAKARDLYRRATKQNAPDKFVHTLAGLHFQKLKNREKDNVKSY